MTEYKYIGKSMPRKDALGIVTGRVKYGNDIKQDNMLIAKILRSPYPHAKITKIDTSKAESFPGVYCVMTYKNAPDWQTGTPIMKPIFDSTVRVSGDTVAALVADTEEIADAALDLIEVEYEQLPAVYTIQEAIKPGAVQIYPNNKDIKNNIAPPGIQPEFQICLDMVGFVRGDVTKGFAESDHVIEGAVDFQGSATAMPPDPVGTICRWEDPNKLTMYIGCQGPTFTKMFLGFTIGSTVDLEVIMPQTGGSFGTKVTTEPYFVAAALAQVVKNRWIKLYYSKEEHISNYVCRMGARGEMKIGIKNNGIVNAFEGTYYAGNSASTDSQGQICIGMAATEVKLARCENWNLQGKSVITNRPGKSGAVRGFGGHECNAVLVPLLAQAIETTGMDPLEFFKLNYIVPGDEFVWAYNAYYYMKDNAPDFKPAMDECARLFGWKDKWKGWKKPTAVNGSKRTGVGVSVHSNADAGEHFGTAYCRLNNDGVATLHSASGDFGNGQRSSLQKMVAEILDISYDNVNMSNCDSRNNPFEMGGGGSRGTKGTGTAVCNAALDAKKKLLERASETLGVPVPALETHNGMVMIKGTDVALPWLVVFGEGGVFKDITGVGSFEQDYSTPNFIIGMVEVEVDTDTGAITCLKAGSGTDAGTVISPIDLKLQMDACIASAGLHTAIYEETIYDETWGRMLNANMLEHKWPTFKELPVQTHGYVQSPIQATHVFHAIGCGEIVTAVTPAAVQMAVYNAIGVRFMDFPITPSKILKALGKA